MFRKHETIYTNNTLKLLSSLPENCTNPAVSTKSCTRSPAEIINSYLRNSRVLTVRFPFNRTLHIHPSMVQTSTRLYATKWKHRGKKTRINTRATALDQEEAISVQGARPFQLRIKSSVAFRQRNV